MADEIFEPVDLYNSQFKTKVKEVAEKYYDELTKKANIDINKNRTDVKKYNDLNLKYQTAKNKLNSSKILGTVAIVFGVIFLIAGVLLIIAGVFKALSLAIGLGVGITLLVLGVILFVLRFTIIKKRINQNLISASKKLDAVNKQYKICLDEMEPLNNSFEWTIAQDVFEQVTPLIQLDPVFDMKKFTYLQEKFGYGENKDPNQSSLFVLSGSINGNPFVLDRRKVHYTVDHVYTGSITIHWTETIHTKDGIQRVSRSQVLTASVTKPKEVFSPRTVVTYGNEAAPNLTFSRSPSGTKGKSEKEIDSLVKSRTKDIQKMAEKAVSKGQHFTALANNEFDALFGATDRNNEVEFRLLFTPLAQNNMVDLIRSQEPYGDDFYFVKEKMLNYIMSEHSQGFDYTCDPASFINHSYDLGKEFFVNYMCEYFKGLYFDLVPILNIPMYQMHKPVEAIYEHPFERRFNSYESEVMANSLKKDDFKPDSCDTDFILKTSLLSTDEEKGSDMYKVEAYGYKMVPQVDYVPTMGGDGRMHNVPVHWYEYVPVTKSSAMDMSEYKISNKEMKDPNIWSQFLDYLQNNFSQFPIVNYVARRNLLGIYLGTINDDDSINS